MYVLEKTKKLNQGRFFDKIRNKLPKLDLGYHNNGYLNNSNKNTSIFPVICGGWYGS
jgi:hypothetical protein